MVRLSQTAARMLVVTVLGIFWFIVSPFIFIYMLPQFGSYRQWMTNYYGAVSAQNEVDVWMTWLLIPEVSMFFIGIFWAGDIIGFVKHHT